MNETSVELVCTLHLRSTAYALICSRQKIEREIIGEIQRPTIHKAQRIKDGNC